MRPIARSVIAALLLAVPVTSAAGETQISWYGYYKLDAIYETAESSHGNFAMWVKEHAAGDAEDVNHVTARQTRAGFDMKREDVTGKLEFDFYGGGAENKNLLQLRKAYVDLPLGGMRLRAGQDADVISPLVPATINYTVAWGQGNIGYRRPQLRLYHSGDGPLSWAAALARNITPDLDGNGIDDGSDGLPAVQGRVGFKAGDDLALGLSGHWGRADVPAAGDDSYDSWSLNGDAVLQISSGVKLLGEVYAGSNLATYFGSILNTDRVDGLASLGGWVNLQLPAGGQQLSLGAALDTVDEDDLAGIAGARSSNVILFGNLQRVLASGVKGGLEVSWMTTKFPNAGAGRESEPTALRVQLAITGSI